MASYHPIAEKAIARNFFRIPNGFAGDGKHPGTLAKIKTLAELKVLICLWRFRNHASGESWPSLTTLATMSGCARGGISRAIKNLVAEGLVERIRSGCGPKKTTHYRLTDSCAGEAISAGKITAPAQPNSCASAPKIAAPAQPNSCASAPKIAAPAQPNSCASAPQIYYEPPNQQKREEDAPAPVESDSAVGLKTAFLSRWKATYGDDYPWHPGKDDTLLAKIAGRLQGKNVAAVLDRFFASDHHWVRDENHSLRIFGQLLPGFTVDPLAPEPERGWGDGFVPLRSPTAEDLEVAFGEDRHALPGNTCELSLEQLTTLVCDPVPESAPVVTAAPVPTPAGAAVETSGEAKSQPLHEPFDPDLPF